MNSYFASPLLLIVDTFFYIVMLIVYLRLIMQVVRADFYNPLAQGVLKATSPVLIPLRRLLPSFGKWDTASLVLLCLLAIAHSMLTLLIHGVSLLPNAVVVFAFIDLVKFLFQFYFFSILIQVILSWVQPGDMNYTSILLHQINRPLLNPVQKLLPPMGGFDLSPMIVLLLLQVAQMLIMPLLNQLL
ncbi:MAG: YggT family protein [Gammaproteobacteria bacterium]|nr:YggT family protein [Gammaproteobacteria bacterium]